MMCPLRDTTPGLLFAVAAVAAIGGYPTPAVALTSKGVGRPGEIDGAGCGIRMGRCARARVCCVCVCVVWFPGTAFNTPPHPAMALPPTTSNPVEKRMGTPHPTRHPRDPTCAYVRVSHPPRWCGVFARSRHKEGRNGTVPSVAAGSLWTWQRRDAGLRPGGIRRGRPRCRQRRRRAVGLRLPAALLR